MNLIPQDLRLAFRQLSRSPGFTATAAVTLALGIGATTAIFAALDHIVLRPLPYPEPDRLVYLNPEIPGEGSDTNWGVSEAGYFHLREHNQAFEEIGAYGGAETGHELTVVGAEGGARVSTAYVSASLLEVLGARPAVGRLILAEEDDWMGPGEEGIPPAVVLGHGFWLREFGGDPGVIGSTLRIEGELGVEIVGVMEPGFEMPHNHVDIWLPLGLHPARTPDSFHGYRVIGRLAPGVTLDGAAADLERLDAQLPEAIPEVYTANFMEETGFRTRAVSLRARVLGGLDDVLWMLFGSVSIVLLVAGANVTNLFLVRAEARRREVAIRQALGVGRAALARQMVIESLLLTLIAAGIGLWLADAALRLFLAWMPAPMLRLEGISISGAGVVAALTVAVLAGVILGVVQLAASSSDPHALRDGGVGRTSKSSRTVQARIVVAQMALTLVLLAAAGIMIRSFERLRAVDPGFDSTDVLLVNLHPPATRHYMQPASVQQLYRDLLDRVGALPGVTDVGVGDVPLTYEPLCLSAYVEGTSLDAGQPPPCVNQSTVAPGYFQTLGIPLEGREPAWAETDRDGRRDAWTGGEVVVTRALAERLWPGEDPIGKAIRLREAGPPYSRVVGVTGDLFLEGLSQPPSEHIFGQVWYRSTTLVVRTRPGAAGEAAAAVRQVVRERDPAVAIGTMRTMDDVIAALPSMARTSLILLLLAIGAVVGLLLSAVGMFGMLTYVVEQRRHEIGIRMAIGARVEHIGKMVVGESLKLAMAGVALGLLGAVVTAQLLRSFLFQVTPVDPATLFVVTLLLVAVALVASWIPARRAAHLDPMIVLRAE